MDLGVSGKVALVCASSKGLGLAIASRLYEEGATIVMCARSKDDLEKASQSIQASYPGRSIPHLEVIDLSCASLVEDFCNSLLKKYGAIDILVNNIGGPPPSSAESTSGDGWRIGFEQVFLSATRMSQLLVPAMKEKKWGRIITVTSLSVVEPIDFLVVSTTMRAAVTAFMKTLSKEVASSGVTVNTVLPGVIHTERIVNLRKEKAARVGSSLEVEMTQTARAIPMGRLGRPQELADLVAFLASENASYITGVNIPVDGGMRHSY
jgi:3-oxoacyl-[acyl-carrier protein] reductase